MKEITFCVAGFPFGVWLPDGWEAGRLLPSFRPFRVEGGEQKDSELFRMEVFEGTVCAEEPVKELIEDTVNDMGHVRLYAVPDGYRIEVSPLGGETVHVMQTDADFTRATVTLCWNDENSGHALCSLLRMIYSQAILRKQAVSVHAAAVHVDGAAYLFMGKSGTGKSTHAALWTSTFEGCRLLNDDNPVIRLENGQAWVYGTPWSGKTPCYRNLGYPVKGMVRLKQAPANIFCQKKEAEAFITLLPACSVIRKNVYLHDCMCDILTQLAALCPVGVLDCLPDKEAARMCRKELNRINN